MKCWILPSSLLEVAILALFVFAPCFAQTDSGLLFGSGYGVDHVMEVVRDMSQAQADFAKLGFNVTIGGRFPGGIYDAIIVKRLSHPIYP